MSETAQAARTAVKTATKPGTPVMSTPPVLTRREEQPKRFSPSALKPLGYGETEMLTITAPAGMTFAEIMSPVAWAHVASLVARDQNNTRNHRDGAGCIVMLDTADNKFIANLRITKVVRDHMGGTSGLELVCIGPSVDTRTGEARPLDLTTGKAWFDPEPAKDTKDA